MKPHLKLYLMNIMTTRMSLEESHVRDIEMLVQYATYAVPTALRASTLEHFCWLIYDSEISTELVESSFPTLCTAGRMEGTSAIRK